MTAAAAFTETGQQQLDRRRSELLQASILLRIRTVARDGNIGFDKHGETDWPVIGGTGPALEPPMQAEVLRFMIAAAIRRGMQKQPPEISVRAARILGMLNQYLWVGAHPFSPELWPTRDHIGEV